MKEFAEKKGGLCITKAKEIAHSRDDFLKIHSQGLELDIYYLQYGFAIEVQGKQHEEWDCSHCTKKLVRIISFDMAVYLENACKYVQPSYKTTPIQHRSLRVTGMFHS
ncbi:unnamed protein product [Rhizophagus irregularis]|nr:unnamed protein product [Rhizophagus irregularis]